MAKLWRHSSRFCSPRFRRPLTLQRGFCSTIPVTLPLFWAGLKLNDLNSIVFGAQWNLDGNGLQGIARHIPPSISKRFGDVLRQADGNFHGATLHDHQDLISEDPPLGQAGQGCVRAATALPAPRFLHAWRRGGGRRGPAAGTRRAYARFRPHQARWSSKLLPVVMEHLFGRLLQGSQELGFQGSPGSPLLGARIKD